MNITKINEVELTEKDKLIIALIQAIKTETQSLIPSIEGVRLIGQIHDRLIELSEDGSKKNTSK